LSTTKKQAAESVQLPATDYSTDSSTLPSEADRAIEEMGCSKESMIFSLMGSSSSRWMARRRFLAP
jgi:hypothetical protein